MMTKPSYPEALASVDTARREIANLKAALQHQIKLTEQQRLRADLAEASAHRAWRLAAGFNGRLNVSAESEKMRGS